MSLPSIIVVARKLGIDLKKEVSSADQERVLVQAMSIDLKPALKFLHSMAHEAKEKGGSTNWQKNPNSKIGKMLIRIHAGDALRKLASKHFCHGLELSFFNCCGGTVGKPPKELMMTQIRHQAGPTAFSDC